MSKYVYVDNAAMFDVVVSECTGRKVLYVDTETNGLDPKHNELILVQICPGEGKPTYVINFKSLSEYNVDRLRMLLQHREIVCYNSKFDLKFLHVYAGLKLTDPKLKTFCCFLAEQMIFAGRVPKGKRKGFFTLDRVLWRRYGVSLDKRVRQQFIGHDGKYFTEQQIRYAADDVDMLIQLRKDQILDAKTWGLTETFRLEFWLVKHLIVMELNGVLIDAEHWRKVLAKQVELKKETYENIRQACIPYLSQLSMFDQLPFSVSSPTQLLKFLQKNVGLDIESTSEEALTYANHPICDLILEYREHNMILKTFGEKLLGKIDASTGRLYPSFNQCGTDTGRFSSSDPNVQQIPSRGAGAELRTCFLAPKGYKLLCADYSQIELRILAELSGENRMIDAYKQGFDGHTNTASVAFGVPLEEVTSEHRKVAKILNFATVYGGGPRAIAKGIMQVLTEDEAEALLESRFGKVADEKGSYLCLAKEFVSTFFAGLPKAKDYLNESGQNAVYNRFSQTPLGRKRFYDTEFEAIEPLRDTEEYEPALEELVASVKRRGMNHPIQGCSADITKVAVAKLGEEFATRFEGKAKVLIQVHDEIVCECPEEYAEEAAKVQEEAMIWAAQQYLHSVPVAVDVHIADYWDKE